MSYRKIAAELFARGYGTKRGEPFSATSAVPYRICGAVYWTRGQ